MLRMFLFLAGLLAGMAGCQKAPPAPAAPVLPGEHHLVGQTFDAVQKSLGKPDTNTLIVNQPHFGPYPQSLQPGEECVYLYYSDVAGEQLHIFCVRPEVYERIHGSSPGGDPSYVLEVHTYPKGVVF